MSLTSRLVGALILTTALVSPSLAWAQSDPGAAPQQPPSGEDLGKPATDQPVDGAITPSGRLTF